MWAVLCLAAAVVSANDMVVHYPVNRESLPKVGAHTRVLIGQDFSVPFYNPKQNQETFILFIAYENINQTSKSLKKTAKKDDNGNAMAVIKYKITSDKFENIGGGVPKDATIDRDQNQLTFQNNKDGSVAGFYWSEIKTTNGNDTSNSQDEAIEVRAVGQCGMTVKWDHGIESNFGWNKNGDGELAFNPTGFRPNDIFASCEFVSNPPTQLSWSTDEIGPSGNGKINGRVPAANVPMEDVIECSMENDKTKYTEDHCKDTPIGNQRTITPPPSKLQYAEDVPTSDAKKVWNYVDNSAENQEVTFRCPLIDQADCVEVVSPDGSLTPQCMNQVSNQLPGDHEDGGDLENDLAVSFDLTHKGYDVKINMKDQPRDVTEFRCRYKTGKGGDLVGYSTPHLVVKYTAGIGNIQPGEEDDNSLVGKWGAGIDSDQPVIKETRQRINVASCFQTTVGYPAPLALHIKTDKMDKYIPKDFTAQHFISLNTDITSDYDMATVSCAYRNGDEIEEEELGEIEVLFKPTRVKADRKGNDIICTADISSQDTATASLSLNENHKVELIDGAAHFNLTNDYTTSEISTIESNGFNCIVRSAKFPDETFESAQVGGKKPDADSDHISEGIEVNLTGPIILCLTAAGCILLICLKMPPNKTKVEEAKYTLGDTEDPEDPVSSA